MKYYSVITSWLDIPDNLNPDKIRRFPEHKGNITVIAINRKVGALAVLVDHVDLSETVKEISAIGDRNLPKTPTNLLCGSKNLIAN